MVLKANKYICKKKILSQHKNVKSIKRRMKSNCKKGKISEYKSMSKDELISAINISKPIKNNKKRDKKDIFKSKREEIKKNSPQTIKKEIF